MSKENMQQEYDINPKYYYDVQSKLHFYHDFSCHIPFETSLTVFKTNILEG